MLTEQILTSRIHASGFTNFNYAEHCTIFLNGQIFLDEWNKLNWGNPPSQSVVSSWLE